MKKTRENGMKAKKKDLYNLEPEQTAKPQTETVLRNSWEQALHANENAGAIWKTQLWQARARSCFNVQ